MNDIKLQQFKELWTNNEFLYATLETVFMITVATFIAYLLGLALGIILHVTSKKGLYPIVILNKILGIIINILRSIPFIILVVALKDVNKLIVGEVTGINAMIVTLIIGSVPYIARLVESSLNEINPGVIEAAQSMGASNFQIIWKVLLPEAKPSLITGLIIATVTIIGYSAMSSSIDGGGLGALAITYGRAKYNNLVIWFCIFIIVVIVQIIQEVGMLIAHKIDKRRR